MPNHEQRLMQLCSAARNVEVAKNHLHSLIREAYSKKIPVIDIAREVGVSRQAIYDILKRKHH